MPIRMMTTRAAAEAQGWRNVTIVHDYPGHEAGLLRHSEFCIHAHRNKSTDLDLQPALRPECISSWAMAREIEEGLRAADPKFYAHVDYCAGPFEPLYMEESYVGAVLDDSGERNGYDDSDFYATVWNATEGRPMTVTYATTRGWTYPNSARADATPEVLAAYEAWKVARAARLAAEREAARLAAEAAAAEAAKLKAAAAAEAKAAFTKGQPVRILRGKHKSAAGVVFWVGAGRTTARVGVQLASGLKEFFNLGQVAPACTCGDDHDCRSTGCDDECPACN